MDIDVFSRDQMPLVMRTLRTALRTRGPLDDREFDFLDAYARVTGHERSPVVPEPLRAEDVTIDGPHQRKRLVQLCALAAMLARPIRLSSLNFLWALSRHLEAHDPAIAAIEAAMRGRRLVARLLTLRRGLRVFVKEAWFSQDIWSAVRLLGVMAGYSNTPLGEMQQACFVAGNRREDGFFFAQMAVLHYHQGVRITPATPATTGLFDPEKLLCSIHRGASSRPALGYSIPLPA